MPVSDNHNHGAPDNVQGGLTKYRRFELAANMRASHKQYPVAQRMMWGLRLLGRLQNPDDTAKIRSEIPLMPVTLS
jgi:hypothetical protein